MIKGALIGAAAIFIGVDIAGHALTTTTVAGVLMAIALLLPWDLRKLWVQYRKDRKSIEELLESQRHITKQIQALEIKIQSTANLATLRHGALGGLSGSKKPGQKQT